MSSDIGLIGLAVMGENLALNMLNKGFRVSVYTRTTAKVRDFLAGRAKGKNVVGCMSPRELCASLQTPRKVFILVKAGKPVDATIEGLLPYLEKGDIVIDGGNSNYVDSQRRYEELGAKGLRFVGCGVSGGEEGALNGPSMMPGGDEEAWPAIKPILQAVSAKAQDGAPCCEWIGRGGAGHFVKMVHNGIEYGDMQLIAEGYTLMKGVLGMSNEEMGMVFKKWNEGEMRSFLVEITGNILCKKDDQNANAYMIDAILDAAGQKGTGKWTAISSLDFGIPLTLIGEAVFARCLSAQKEQRVHASGVLSGPSPSFAGSKDDFVGDLQDALYAAKLVSYAQGFVLIQEASAQYKWNLNFGSISAIWRAGCIIQSAFLSNIKEAFDRNRNLENLLLDSFFHDRIRKAQPGWRRVCCQAITNGVPIPALTTALSYYDGYRTADGSANMIQAQRDYFGAHTFERKDRPRGEWFHCNWTGRGGSTTSGSYSTGANIEAKL